MIDKFPCVVQSINFGGLQVAYGVDRSNGAPSYYGCYRASYKKDLIGLCSNFIPLTKDKDLAGDYQTIMDGLNE